MSYGRRQMEQTLSKPDASSAYQELVYFSDAWIKNVFFIMFNTGVLNMEDNDLKQLLQDLRIFEEGYDTIRIVDPVKKKVLSLKNNIVLETEQGCFSMWERNQICENCISIRAYNEEKSFVKVEYAPEYIYIVTAIPVKLNDRLVVIELLKDATHSMILEHAPSDAKSEIHALIDNLNVLALRDELTGVYNRRYINQRLPVDMINASVSGRSLSVIMADIDFFKKVNDTYGHLAGDAVLKQFTRILQGCLQRSTDWVARYGGEEFLMVLPDCDAEKAGKLAEKMRHAVNEHSFDIGHECIHVTSSFGVNSMKEYDNPTFEELIADVDKKLYRAKTNGRNRVDS